MQHDLSHQKTVRITGQSPGKGAEVFLFPGNECSAKDGGIYTMVISFHKLRFTHQTVLSKLAPQSMQRCCHECLTLPDLSWSYFPFQPAPQDGWFRLRPLPVAGAQHYPA